MKMCLFESEQRLGTLVFDFMISLFVKNSGNGNR
jgi:hypothetical protein